MIVYFQHLYLTCIRLTLLSLHLVELVVEVVIVDDDIHWGLRFSSSHALFFFVIFSFQSHQLQLHLIEVRQLHLIEVRRLRDR